MNNPWLVFRKMRSSLDVQLTAWYGISAFVVVLISTSFLYWWMARNLRYDSSRLLEDKLQAIRLIAQQDTDYSILKRRVEDEWARRKIEKIYVKVVTPDGKTVTATPHLDPSAQRGFDLVSSSPFDELSPLTLPGEQQFLALRATIEDASGRPLKVALILDSSDHVKILREYREAVYFVLGFALLICMAVGKRIASRGVRPIREITRQSGRIRSTNLHERLNVKSLPVELAELASTFNEMLNHLESSFERLSQFSADIAHELRMPVTNMSGEIEVTLGKARTVETYQDVLGSCLEECGRLSRIIDSLLFLARCENPTVSLKREKIRLQQELAAVLEFYEASALEAGIELTLEASPHLQLEVERTLFQRAVGNLIANAIRHTSSQGKIKVLVDDHGENVRISIEDNGDGIPSDHLPHLFDRFYRVDASRSQDSGGSGLGLAIVNSIAKLHGGTVEIQSQIRKGTRVELRFPKMNYL